MTDKIESTETLKDILLDMLFAGNTVGVVHIGPDGVIKEADPDFSRILGLPDTEILVGKTVASVFKIVGMSDPKTGEQLDPGLVPTQVMQGLDSRRVHTSERLVRTLDGRNVHMNSYFNGKGDLVSVVRDISEDMRQRRLLEMAMDSANAGYWSLNYMTGKYTYSRSLLNRLTDAERAKIQEHGLFSIIHRDDMAEIVRSWQQIMNGELPFDIKYRVVLEKEGVIWQQSLGQLERGADGSLVGVTAFNRDITKEVVQQNDLKEAEQASNAKSEFLARMSHEVRTPLNAIIGMADSLSDEYLSPDVREAVNDIEHAAEGLHSLLSRTLDHAKIMSKKMEISPVQTDPRDIIRTCEKLWRPQCSAKNLSFTVHIADDLPNDALIDSFRIQQCLNNLLSNAIKFTEKGRIDLHLKSVELSGRNHLVFAVKDTGIGMTPQQQETIFSPFVQADDTISRKYGGTGLGTSIAKQLTELMGGKLKVKSAPNEGTIFAMIIPMLNSIDELSQFETQITAESAPEPEPKTVPTPVAQVSTPTERSIQEITSAMNQKDESGRIPPPKAFEGLSVLCVEDNPMNQKVVGRLIGKHVTDLNFANNGMEAIELLSKKPIDVVLMDIHMPVMNGIEATMEIRDSGESWANVAIIALTADPDYQQKDICRQIGMNGTIAKPVRRKDIMGAFDQVLKNQWKKAG